MIVMCESNGKPQPKQKGKKVRDLTEEEKVFLIYDLLRDSAEVQGVEIGQYCLEYYGIEW